jgi:hypothetical protein
MAFTPLTPQQYQSARNAGFSSDSIIQMEQRRKSESSPAPVTSPQKQADLESKQKYGAFIAPNTENPTVPGESSKTIANMIPSAFNFIKGAIDLINPVSTVKKIKEVITGFGGAKKDVQAAKEASQGAADAQKQLISVYQQDKASGKDVSHMESYFNKQGIDPNKGVVAKPVSASTIMSDVKERMPGGPAYEALIPESARGLISATGGGLKYAFAGDNLYKQAEGLKQAGEGLQTAQRAVVSDPVGQIAPFLLAGKPIAEKLGVGSQFDKAISKTAQVVEKPFSYAFGKAKDMTTGTTKFATSQATGLQPKTISQILETPKEFSKQAMTSIDRSSLGKEVQSSLSQRTSILKETGKAYEPVRESSAQVKVSPTFLDTIINDLTGLKFSKKGRWETSSTAKLRDSSDVRSIQHLYDLWKPAFKKGYITADEFLNFRTDLANLSKFERQIGKSKPIEDLTKIARGRFNEAYRPQLEGLEGLDIEFSKQIKELRELTHGLVDKSGNITDTGISKIANLTENKPNLAVQLEQIVPGITQKVKILKAIEDIQHASGIKVGTYSRAAITGGAFFLGGPLQAIITAVLTSPEMAVPILRSYGLLKNSRVVQGVINALRTGGQAINQLPEKTPAVLNKDIKKIKMPAGLSIKDVSKNTAIPQAKAYGMGRVSETSKIDNFQTGERIVTPVVRYATKATGNTDSFRGGTWYATPESSTYNFAKVKGIGGPKKFNNTLDIKKPLVIKNAVIEDGSFSVINSGYENYIPSKYRGIANDLWNARLAELDEVVGKDYFINELRKALKKNGNTEAEIDAIAKSTNQYDSAMDSIISKGLSENGFDALVLENKYKGKIIDRHIFKIAENVNETTLIPLEKAMTKFDQTGTADVVVGKEYGIGIKDEGDFISVKFGPNKLMKTDEGLRGERNFATKEEAFDFAGQIQKKIVDKTGTQSAFRTKSPSAFVPKQKGTGQSLDEWVKGQGEYLQIKRGEPKTPYSKTAGIGKSYTIDENVAKVYGKNGKIIDAVIKKDDVLSYNKLDKDTQRYIKSIIDERIDAVKIGLEDGNIKPFEELMVELSEIARIKNKKAIDVSSFGIPSESEIRVLSDDILKTRSQLKAEWDGVGEADGVAFNGKPIKKSNFGK